jgi:hypothetical protein
MTSDAEHAGLAEVILARQRGEKVQAEHEPMSYEELLALVQMTAERFHLDPTKIAKELGKSELGALVRALFNVASPEERPKRSGKVGRPNISASDFHRIEHLRAAGKKLEEAIEIVREERLAERRCVSSDSIKTNYKRHLRSMSVLVRLFREYQPPRKGDKTPRDV